ncbi:hypothetical protein MLD38_002175 [Melastoma candidum]|uniref:Uncharacterized protein n=1 Tax=Melastoma candidum TaxID=119954 RepID=A0ACB9SKI8_9MYRT|nr:hypothetical protein MLD38_002175 [Melastoma candidum]
MTTRGYPRSTGLFWEWMGTIRTIIRASTAARAKRVREGQKWDMGQSWSWVPRTPLPDKKLLVFILDRLQKKDTYGVFSEPVDPEELPDYHDIIKHPMDFGSVRKKLDDGEYSNLEQFEKDIFLICSNAVEYNKPDTVFFKQARAMQEIARKDFENLRQDSDSEPQQPKVVRRARPPGSVQRKTLEKSPLYCIGNEVSPDAVLGNGDNVPWLCNTYNLRREPPVKNLSLFESNGLISHRTPNSESHSSWLTEMENEFPGSVWRNVTKNGKRLTFAEEHRRETYNQQLLSRNEESSLGVFDKQTKQLVMVGLQFEHGYARSLARFAENLGPVAWKFTSRKIQSVLHPGVGFGPGWVRENENAVKPPQVDAQKCSTNSIPSKSPPSGHDAETVGRLKFTSTATSSPGDQSFKAIPSSLPQNLAAVPNGFIPRFTDASRRSDVSRSPNFTQHHSPKVEPDYDRQVSQMGSSGPATVCANNNVRNLMPGSSNPGCPPQQPGLGLALQL